MLKHFLYILLLLLFLADVVYSFKQHYHAPMDGDMPSHILPDAAIKPVLDHPLGLYAIIHHKAYADPNRFFCHWSLKTYFDHVPFWLQKAVSPIKSLYLSCAIAKTIFQI